jgi:hypothetical protein
MSLASYGQVTNRADYIEFPTAQDTQAYTDLQASPQWLTGNLAFSAYYTGSVNSATVFHVQIIATAYAAADALSGTGRYQVSFADSVTGSATAGNVYLWSFSTRLPIDPQVKFVKIVLTRQGASLDTNTGSFRLLGLIAQYQPNRNAVGVKA